MSKTTTDYRKDLQELETRRESLLIDKRKAEQRLSKQREKVISGKAEVSTLEPFQTAQTSVDGIILAIEQRISELQTEIAHSAVIDNRNALINELLTIDLVCEKNGESSIEADKQFAIDAQQHAETKLTANKAIEEAKSRADIIVNQLIPGATSAYYQDKPDVSAKLEELWSELKAKGASLSVLRSREVFATHHFYALDEDNAFPYPKLPFSYPFRLVIQESIANQKNGDQSDNS